MATGIQYQVWCLKAALHLLKPPFFQNVASTREQNKSLYKMWSPDFWKYLKLTRSQNTKYRVLRVILLYLRREGSTCKRAQCPAPLKAAEGFNLKKINSNFLYMVGNARHSLPFAPGPLVCLSFIFSVEWGWLGSCVDLPPWLLILCPNRCFSASSILWTGASLCPPGQSLRGGIRTKTNYYTQPSSTRDQLREKNTGKKNPFFEP